MLERLNIVSETIDESPAEQTIVLDHVGKNFGALWKKVWIAHWKEA